jgi:predicted Zn-dependent protease
MLSEPWDCKQTLYNMLQNKFVIALLKQVFFCLLLPGLYANAVTTQDLPDIGESTGNILSPEFERRLGQAFLNQIRRQTDIIDDPEIETYVQSVGYRLVAQSDNNSQLFTFFAINDPAINAFAAPGGIVGINAGTIINSETESELAGVIAHEIAHVTQRHMARSVEMNQKMNIPMIAAMLGAILVATQNADAGAAALMAVQGSVMQAQINFTRGNEEEADRVGMQLLQRAEFNPMGMPGFFQKLQKNSRYAAQAPEFLRTHPLTTNRIADALSRADRSTPFSSYHESNTYKLIRTKLIVKTYEDPVLAIDFYSNKLDKQEFTDDAENIKYGLALAYLENRDYAAATKLLDGLLAVDKNNTSFLLARADLEVQQGKYNEAISIYERMDRLFPDYRPLILSYSNTLIKAKQPKKAKEILESYGRYHTPDITYFTLLGRAEAEAGNIIESSIANAEYYFLTGETRVAIDLLKDLIRRRSPKPDYYQEEIILSRISQLETELRAERKLMR